MDVSSLNEGQLKAVTSTADRILCLAGAGTGKTYSMIARILNLVESGVNPESILVMTFTNAAAFEMTERYRKQATAKTCPEFRTFHSFCYSLLAKDKELREAVGYANTPTIASDADVKKVEQRVKLALSCKLSDAVLHSDGSMLSLNEKRSYDVFHKMLKRELRERGIITFDALCSQVCKLFFNNHPTTDKYKAKYRYIFVDEFQDTDPKQFQFVSSFTQSKFFVVGDALQALYSFRGATSEIIKMLSVAPGWEVIRLTENYRSTNQICDFANRMSHYADDAYRVEITGHRDGESVHSEVQPYVKHGELPYAVMDNIIKEYKASSGVTAILVRSNKEVDALVEFFDHKGIRCSTGRRNVEAVNILKSASDNNYLIDWLASALNAHTYAEYIRMSTLVTSRGEEYTVRNFAKDFGSNILVNKRLSKVRAVRKAATAPKPILSIFADIAAILRLPDMLLEEDMKTVSDLLNYMIERLEADNSSDLYVGTIHSSKGLEYDNVILLNVNSVNFPIKDEDSKNLYYVGITRAKNRLFVYMC